jgi:type I restriction enzyme S subunit
MQEKKGYKQTEVGVIPENWEVIEIGQFIDFKNGLNKEKKYFGHGSPIINYMDVFKHPFVRAENILGKVSLTKAEIQAYRVQKGDVFFTRTSETVEEIGISSVLVNDSPNTVYSGFVLRGRDKSNILSNDFKKYCFLERDVRRQIVNTASYTTRALTNGRLLSRVLIKVPPLPEQAAIATALSDMDALIAQTEQLIEKKKAIKQGVMQELLKPKEGWVRKKLGEVGKCLRGVSYNPENDLHGYSDSTNYSLLRSNNIYDGMLDFGNLQYVDKSRVKEQQVVRDLDIVICMANGSKQLVGKSALAHNIPKDRYTFGAFMGCFRAIDTVNPKFIFALLQTNKFRNYIDVLLSGSSINNLNPGNIESIEFEIPDLDEQNQIVESIDSQIMELTFLGIKLHKLKLQKQGMMQALLTGKIRLV